VSIEVSEGGWDAPNREEADRSLDSEGSTRHGTGVIFVGAHAGNSLLLLTIFMSDMRFLCSLSNNRYLFHSKKFKEQK
jgi:hypothetical protein